MDWYLLALYFAIMLGGILGIFSTVLLVKARFIRDTKRDRNLASGNRDCYNIDHRNPKANQSSTMSVQSIAKFESMLNEFLRNNNISQRGERDV